MAFNVEIKLRQKKLLGIFDELLRVCESNHLTYYLGGGSLIGALRHKGFIPWDDDMDIFMPRRDYEKLFKIWNNVANTEQYSIFRTNDKQNYHFRCIGVVDKNTTVIKKYNVDEDLMHGLFIDIMPLDGIPASKFRQLIQLLNVIIYNIYNVQRPPNFEDGIVTNLSKIALKIISSQKLRYKLWHMAEKNISEYDLFKTKYCKELSTNTKALRRPLPSEWFRQTKFAEFEGRQVRIPIEAEKYMTLIFGDYMQLPPESERIPKHDETVLFEELNTPYEKYRGIYYLIDRGRE